MVTKKIQDCIGGQLKDATLKKKRASLLNLELFLIMLFLNHS